MVNSRWASRSEAGFSIVEVLVALAIILIALSATSQILVSTTAAIVNQQQLTLARGILYSKISSELMTESRSKSDNGPYVSPPASGTFPVNPVNGPVLTRQAHWSNGLSTSDQQNGIVFTVDRVWGWCSPTGLSPSYVMGNYTVLPSEPLTPVYEMAIRVSWVSKYPSSVSQVVVIPLPFSAAPTYQYPTSSNDCPAALK
ncbi:MAG: type IV pilus modification PilV family protein [Acidimicrobiales bacterium]